MYQPPVPHQKKEMETKGEAGVRPALRAVLLNPKGKNSGTWLGSEGPIILRTGRSAPLQKSQLHSFSLI